MKNKTPLEELFYNSESFLAIAKSVNRAKNLQELRLKEIRIGVKKKFSQSLLDDIARLTVEIYGEADGAFFRAAELPKRTGVYNGRDVVTLGLMDYLLRENPELVSRYREDKFP